MLRLIITLGAIGMALIISVGPVPDVKVHNIRKPYVTAEDLCDLDVVTCDNQFYAYVSAYNTTKAQTNNSPCISASGDNICGRTDVVACPRNYKLGTRFKIRDNIYTCLDRTSIKYNNRFDISFDKDVEGAINFGKQYLKIEIIK